MDYRAARAVTGPLFKFLVRQQAGYGGLAMTLRFQHSGRLECHVLSDPALKVSFMQCLRWPNTNHLKLGQIR